MGSPSTHVVKPFAFFFISQPFRGKNVLNAVEAPEGAPTVTCLWVLETHVGHTATGAVFFWSINDGCFSSQEQCSDGACVLQG